MTQSIIIGTKFYGQLLRPIYAYLIENLCFLYWKIRQKFYFLNSSDCFNFKRLFYHSELWLKFKFDQEEVDFFPFKNWPREKYLIRISIQSKLVKFSYQFCLYFCAKRKCWIIFDEIKKKNVIFLLNFLFLH
jgi:hypothetical protein